MLLGKNVSPPGKSRPNCKLTPLWKNGTYTASRESPSPVNPGTMYTPITVRTRYADHHGQKLLSKDIQAMLHQILLQFQVHAGAYEVQYSIL